MALRILRELSHGASHQGVDFQVRAGAQLPVLELDEGQPHVLPGSGKAPAGDREAWTATASFSSTRKWLRT